MENVVLRCTVNISITCLNAQIAQLVEQRTENPRVTGSIPVLGIFLCNNLLKRGENKTEYGGV